MAARRVDAVGSLDQIYPMAGLKTCSLLRSVASAAWACLGAAFWLAALSLDISLQAF
jgi:hypothetical protein